MTLVVWTYLAYLTISVLLTAWVARVLFRRGGVFLIEAFRGNAELAESVNHLLVVGFYLINIGYVTLALKYGDRPGNAEQAVEALSTKVGLVLVILGVMHFFNLFLFSGMRRGGIAHAKAAAATTPPPATLAQA